MYVDGPLPVISTYNPIYGMYNPIEITRYNHLWNPPSMFIPLCSLCGIVIGNLPLTLHGRRASRCRNFPAARHL